MRSKTLLGEKIFTLRKQQGLTQGDLADKVGVSRAAISQFELGDTTPSVETHRKIAEALGADLLIADDANIPTDSVNDQFVFLRYFPITSYSALISVRGIYPYESESPIQISTNNIPVLRLPNIPYEAASVIEINGNSMAPRYPHGARYVVTGTAALKDELKLISGVYLFFLRNEPPFVRRIISNKGGVLTLKADATGEEFELEINWLDELALEGFFSLYKVGQAVHMPPEE